MITCPNCHHQELEGTLFCNDCGAKLIAADSMVTQAFRRTTTGALKKPFTHPHSAPGGTASLDTPVSLHFLDSGEVIHLSGQREYSLGRSVEGRASPDIDLSPYEAYAQGVSRLHATLKLVNQRVWITDLDSSNGTRVNGQKISPNIDFPLNHGDLIVLGKLKMQFLIRKS